MVVSITPRYAINIIDWKGGDYLIEVFTDSVESGRVWCKIQDNDWMNVEHIPDWIERTIGLKIIILKCVLLAHKGHLPEYWCYNPAEALKSLRNELILI